jgi:hypothetical protein
LRCHVIIWCPQQSFGVGLEVSIWMPLSPFGIDQSSWIVVWDATWKHYFIYYSYFTLIFYFTSLWCVCVSFFWGWGADSNINILHHSTRRPGSSVGIVTAYGLDGPGLNPGRDEIFCPSRPVLGPKQPPVQWVPGLSRG